MEKRGSALFLLITTEHFVAKTKTEVYVYVMIYRYTMYPSGHYTQDTQLITYKLNFTNIKEIMIFPA